ncbi:pentatricopeptide repeat-containing protein At1g08070, chloroplastic-like [Vicia villosa]|uniref:pentatricopeptide repeat-containing protein At1g08070, chloroplastic-like n=1 Tax=Vicia villosa TaxID=3911 RepID=UPI00273AA33A|nr:pentatricopeptide repeat-containing protein At1g08070, chloroplastic-like [Vicia villosa]
MFYFNITKIPNIKPFQTRFFTTTSSILNLCTKPQHLQQIHARFFLHGLHQNSSLSSKLIDSYSNFGLLHFSHKLFHYTENPDSLLYNAYLRSLFRFGEYEKTLFLYKEMVEKSMCPDEDSCFSVLKCWNGLIYEAYESGKFVESFQFFCRMRKENVQPNSVTVINLLRVSIELNSLKMGKVLHSLVVVSDLCKDLTVNTAVLSMYVKLGDLEDARMVFEKMPEKDVVVWNIMISAYSGKGYSKESLELLYCMVRSGVRPDLFTAIPAISSITKLKFNEWGKQMHAQVMRNGSDYQVSVHNSLIDMYSMCDNINSAQKIFGLIVDKTVVSWSAMIKGYAMHGRCFEALSLFVEMKLCGTKVDFVIVINILPAFAKIGALHYVRYLHGYSLKTNLDSLKSLKTSLLSSYAKCGCIEMARKLFDEEKNSHKDIIAWNSMITAYSNHGEWFQCFQLYDQMKLSNVKPDQVSFLGILTACVNSGLVEKGKEIFKEMVEIYGHQPSKEHNACMVDLLGRAGKIDEASEIIENSRLNSDAKVYGPLLSACKMHDSESDFAELAAEKLINMEPKNAGNYVLLSNIYAAAGKWEKVAKMRSFLRDRGLKKIPGCSWVELNGLVHEFRVADQNHSRAEDIYSVLKVLEFEAGMENDDDLELGFGV